MARIRERGKKTYLQATQLRHEPGATAGVTTALAGRGSP